MKTALVTGGAQRVGKGIVQALANEGYAIAIHYRASEKEAAALAQQVKDNGGHAVTVQGDLSNAEDVESLIDRACQALASPLTCLINNASTFEYDTITTLTPETWSTQLAVNLQAPAFLSQAFAAQLPTGDAGCIINILDQRIEYPNPTFLSYGISKVGLASLTESLAIALAPHIRVNGVAPGLTLPSGQQTQAQFEQAQSRHLLGAGPSVADIAQAVTYLVNATVVTGQILFVDGGERFHSDRNENDIIGSS